MSSFRINGGNSLKGEITPQGAKNETLQILCAVLLTDELVTIENIPDIIDVNLLIDLLKGIGVEVKKIDRTTYTFKSSDLNISYTKSEDFFIKSSKIRGSIMLMGPMIARYGSAYIAKPGGDKIGRRRVDTHFDGLKKLGASFSVEKNNSLFKISSKKLKGTNILLDEASVTGTANIIMAASLAKGKTIIKNASELKVKEAERLSAISKGLDKLNIRHELFTDGLSIYGNYNELDTTEVIDSYGDHRIAMSFLIAGIRTKDGLAVKNCENIKTSFPSFKDIMNSIGMKIDEKN